MSLRNYGWLIGTTFAVGGIGGILVGFLVAGESLFAGTWGNLAMGILMNMLVGLTISVVAQMGFFAYMTVNYLALSFLRSPVLWRNIQLFLILFTAFDMVYLRYQAFGEGKSIWPFVLEALALLFVSVVTAFAKVKLTNAHAWVPTVFFLFVVTVIEWIPGLRQNDPQSLLFMVVPLLFCNVWQVMHLHRLTRKS